MTEKAEQFYRSAQEHAGLVLKMIYEMDNPINWISAALGSESATVESMRRQQDLIIRCLFPNVDDGIFDIFASLAWFRQAWLVSSKHPAGNQPLRVKFEESQLRALGLVDDMLPIQQEILKEKYLKPPWEDTNSTG